MNKSLIIIGILLIISCLFYDELYNKNVENMSDNTKNYLAVGVLAFLTIGAPMLVIFLSSHRIEYSYNIKIFNII